MMNETFQSIAEEVKALVEEKLGSAREEVQEQIEKALSLEAQIEELEKGINEAQLDSSIGLTSIRVVSDELAKRIEELEAIEIYHGQDGADGKDGIDGQDGADGAIGPAGADGSDGRDGIDGLGVDTPLWAEGVYREGSLVQANHGQFFKAIRDTSSDVNSDDWERVGTAGFRMTGAFDNDRQYSLGDLFIKDFGLFLSDGNEHKLIAGRGPQGKKGERGLPGKDGIGIDGKDGKDGRDGDTFDCIELSGTNLVVVMKDADDQLLTKTVDLSPVLDVAAEVTKSIETKTQKQFVEVWNEQAKSFSQRLQQHLLDQEAIPVAFYRGLWTAGQSYIRGDLVTFGGALYVSRVTTESTPKSVFEVGGDWVQVSAAAGAGGSGGSGGSGDGSVGPILTSQVMLTHPQRYNFKTQEDANKYFAESLEKLEVIHTDDVQTNPNVMFRDAKGRFKATPEELEKLTNQMEVNRWILDKLEQIESGDIDLSDYATVEQLNEVDTASIERDKALQAHIDNISDALPENPKNSAAINIGEQVVEITGSRPTGAGGEAGKILIWKAETGGPGTPYNECKFIVPDTSVIDLDATFIWWKQGNKVQRWDITDGWFTNANVLHYSASETSGDALLDGQAAELWYENPDEATAEYFEVISRAESKSDDRKLQVEIEEIALALETLLVQREHGQWKYVGFSGDTIPRNAGEFSLAVDDIASSQENIITINQEDLKGITHGFGDVEVGDFVEIVNTEEPTSYALFTVTKAPEGTGIVNVEVALKDKGYNIWIGETCEIRFFAINEQDLNLTDLDNRYLRLSGGTMEGGATLRVNTLEPVNMPFIYYEGDPDNTHAAGLINRYMMNQYAVNKAGDTMTGILEVPRVNVKKDGEAVCLIEGTVSGQATSARLTFSNKIDANAYGSLSWNGNNGQGWFQFNKDVDFSTKGLHSVNNIRLSGNKTIQEATNTRIKFDNKVVITKTGTNRAGFVLKGKTAEGDDGDLLNVYHNSSGLDAINYHGKQDAETNLATVGYVNSKVGGGGGSPASAKIQAGIQMWNESRLVEGCFNLVDENQQTTSNCKFARGLTFHTYTSYDDWPWMKWALRSGGQIHLTDMNGKYLMSKPVLSAEKRDSGSGADPVGALWFFELSIYGFEAETSLSGLYIVEFENCLSA